MAAGNIGDASRLAFLHGPTTTWTEAEIAALWEGAVRSPASPLEPQNCVYVHVPFCKSICHFCNYDRLQPSSPDLLKTWLARVLGSIDTLSPGVRRLTFHSLYIGGGTPSVLPARMLHELLHAIDTKFAWHPRASRKLEFDPGVMNRERLTVLVEHGFRDLSFGIQTLDPEVNSRHNRGRQGLEMIEHSFEDLKALGIDTVACDFLIGLEGTSPEGILAELETVLRRFRPTWVDVFMLTPTHEYVKRFFGESWNAFWAHYRRFEDVVPAALPALANRAGYVVQVGQGHHMCLKRRPGLLERLKPIRLPICSYTPLAANARRPVNVLGLGRSARSGIFGVAAFESRDPGDDPAIEGAPHYSGHRVDVGGEATSYLAHRLRDTDSLDRAEFEQVFGRDVTDVIPEALAGWQLEGTARLDERALRFVPQDRLARIRSLMWLVPREAIEFDLGRQGTSASRPAVTRLRIAGQ